MDVEMIADELYGLTPNQFTAARDAYVAEARKAKDPAAAKAIAALRRPVAAAWAANLLARQQPQETARFLTLGENLREAHRTLDAEQLRTASRQQHQLVTTLARTAAALAGEAGQPVSDTVLQAIEQILHGVLAHPDVARQWAAGRLVRVPEATVDFTAIAPETAPPRPAPAASPAKRTRPNQRQRHDDDARLRDLERARTAAAQADTEAARCEQELREAREAESATRALAEEAGKRVRRLEHDLRTARQEQQQSVAASAQAREALKAAERAAREARRAAERSHGEAERLGSTFGSATD
ncbi:hypothetical protein [Streptomyces sp. NPDC046385]|uniref:hypothetical protein n=1 Tax=unclassified Streptomyces TaxID=2593676 RepID=UPI0033F3BD7E